MSEMFRRFIRATQIEEFDDLSQVAGRRISGIGTQIRANLIPPLWRELPRYGHHKFRADVVAALTIAIITVPQAIGFAFVAGLPIAAVLATAIVGSFFCAFYTSSRHLVFGPTNTISAILAGALIGLSDVPLSPLAKVLLLGLLIGLVQLTAGLTKLGHLTQFISRTVIIAYTTAVGILIAVGQVGNLLGIRDTPVVGLPSIVRHLVVEFFSFNFSHSSALVGVASFAAIYSLRRLRPRWPEGLIVLGAATLVCTVFTLDRNGVRLVRDVGVVTGGMPIFTGFPLNAEGVMMLPRITGTAIAIALLGMLEAISIAKSLAAKSGERIDANQELIGMGLGNIAATTFGAMPGSASFLRSAAHLQSGGQTQFAAIMSSAVLLGFVVVLSPYVNYIPVPAIAAYLIVVAMRLFDAERIVIARRATVGDAAVFWLTLASALFLQLDTAIYVGVSASLVLFLQKASTPALAEHAFDDRGQLIPITAPSSRNSAQVSIVHVEGDLFFGAADLFQDGIRRLAEDPGIRVFILRLKHARHLDATTVMALAQLHEYLVQQGRHLLISGIHGDVAAVLKRSGLDTKIGHANIFPAEENATLATKKALQRAQSLIGTKPELRVFYTQNASAA